MAREKIIKLGQKITDRVGVKVTENEPEYWGLDSILTDEMADIALKMDVRKPVTLDELVKKTGIEKDHLEKVLQEMACVGIIEYNWENEKREKQYVLPMFVPGSAEFTNMSQKQLEEHPELGKFFENMSRLPLEKVTPFVPMGGAGIGMHVIPVEKAIKAENETVSIEKISYWLDKYEGKYAASPCSCRLSRRTFDEGCADNPEDWCIGVGDMADYLVETNRGHYITKDEVYKILKHAEDLGFVHQITNIDGENKIFAICNCNVNVCYALRTSQLFNTPNLSRSAYVAKVNKEDCVACGKCVESCPAGAVKLGQKLCRKDGSEVEYPRQVLPDDVRWGRHMWSPDYRDVNRKNSYDSGTSPCKSSCPAHIAVQGYLKLASLGKYDEALALIKKDNPLPAVCGRICNRRCEEACTRGTIDKAVAIDSVKDFLASRDLKAETRYVPEKFIPSNRGPFMEKIAIIGAGPAGLSAAYFLSLMGYTPTVFDRHSKAGGMLRYGIPSFKLEKDVIEAEVDIIRELGVEFRFNTEVGKDVSLSSLRKEGYKAFYLAVGCSEGRKPGIPGEEGDGAYTALELLADPEGTTLGKRTVVVGGGNVAIDAARTAVRKSDEVKLFSLEQRDEMPASDEEIEEAESEGIIINPGWGPKEVVRDESGRITAIIFKKCTSVYDREKRFSPVYDENDTLSVECDSVVFAIGQKAQWKDLLEGENVTLRRNGLVEADALTYQTSVPDIFAGGDIYTGPKFAIDAIAAGREAAISMHRFVQPHSSLTIGRNRRDFNILDRDDILVKEYDRTERQTAGKKENADGKSFRDTRLTLTEEQVKKETARCLSCGASVVDPNRCLGCGVCTTKCEFDAIRLYRVHPEASTMIRSEDKIKAVAKYAIKRGIRILRNPNSTSDPAKLKPGQKPKNRNA